MMAYIGNGGISPLILKLTGPAALIRYPFNGSVVGSKNKSGRFGEDNNLLPHTGIRNTSSVRSLVFIPAPEPPVLSE